ncbi:hypothetical protein E2C01_001412 [Portunus trituberculatus]|uniref:Uncharacterized protein n=1 Tax=Portunus trituberculatus TaxID=210409 RepID=A0A5B7CHX5_PORTR|nr:hypothetical protein [Portunus trituberculatus]
MDRIRTHALGDPADPKACMVPLYHGFSTPALADALGETKPEPERVYVVVMERNTPPVHAMTTLAPNELSIDAIPLPRPVPPPVMKAVFPLNVSFGSMAVFSGGK